MDSISYLDQICASVSKNSIMHHLNSEWCIIVHTVLETLQLSWHGHGHSIDRKSNNRDMFCVTATNRRDWWTPVTTSALIGSTEGQQALWLVQNGGGDQRILSGKFPEYQVQYTKDLQKICDRLWTQRHWNIFYNLRSHVGMPVATCCVTLFTWLS